MPKFRVLTDAAEQLAAYQADRRSMPAVVPGEVLLADTGSVDQPGHPSEMEANRILLAHRLAEMHEAWRALPRKRTEALRWARRTWIAEKLRLLPAKVTGLLGDEVRCHLVRHLVMRWSLGAVLAWFAAQQLYDPDAWTHFVPSFMPQVAGLPEATLIRLHGSLLLLSSVGLLVGTRVRLAAGLAATILVQIISALSINGGEANLVARDVGLLGLALGLVFDPTRVSAREFPKISVSMPHFRRQPLLVHPMLYHPTNVAAAAFAAGAHAASGTAVREAQPLGNGDIYPAKELRAVPEAELLGQHDEPVVSTTNGVKFPVELPRSEGDLNDQRMLRLTEKMARLTWLLAGLTVLNLITAIVIAIAAVIVIGRGG
jgi:hypothetical protein